MSDAVPVLSPLEARVLGVLVEKQRTVPDAYPLTLNSLVAGCNQKTSRDPIMHITESEAQMTLHSLRGRSLVIESSGASGRVMRYEHNVEKALRLPPAMVALLTVLMLRGPQTPGELRTGCERLHRFGDISLLEACLEEMSSRAEGAIAVKLPKQPGSREHRYAHLLCGAVQSPVGEVSHAAENESVSVGEIAALKANLGQVRGEVDQLRQMVEHLYAELGVARRS
jgi:uncharacterized protein YceH (UPF0502 family)